MINTLLPQQEKMCDFMESHREAAIFADPGLGKTLATLETIRRLKDDCGVGGVLVVAPLRVARITWPAEILKWTRYTWADMRTPEGAEAWRNGSADIYIINTEYLQQFCERFLKGKSVPVDMLVIDELGMFRTHSSKRAKALRSCRRYFSRFVGLTGTPSPHGYEDLFGQIRMLDGGERLGKSFHAFRRKYFDSDYMGYKWTATEESKREIERKIVDMAIVMTASEWLSIPPVAVEDVDVALPREVCRDYRILEKELLLEIESAEVAALSEGVLVNKLRQMTGGAVFGTDAAGNRTVIPVHTVKIDKLREIHESIGRRPMLVGVQYTHETERILEAIPWAKAFNEKDLGLWNKGAIPMWVAHPQSMKYGLNCQGACCDITWFSMPYDYDQYQQFNARVARTGQRKPTTIRRMMAADTIDWAVAEVLRNRGRDQFQLLFSLQRMREARKAA